MLSTNEVDSSDDEDIIEEEETIHWVNIIFLPFESWWQILMLFISIVKISTGAYSMVFPTFGCINLEETNPYLFYLGLLVEVKDPLYLADTFLYIVHRQVTEEAMKQVYTAKPAIYLFLDIFSLIPLHTVVASNSCETPILWPSVLMLNEFVVIYRVADYFSLNTNHNACNLVFGYMLTAFLTFHTIACFQLLMSPNLLCKNCDEILYKDWRIFFLNKWIAGGNNTAELYLYAYSYVENYFFRSTIIKITPQSVDDFVIVILYMFLGYCIMYIVIQPKIFAEIVTRIKYPVEFQHRTQRIIKETHRRNPSPTAAKEVTKFYSLIWKKRKGIITLPSAIEILPHFLQSDVNQDLVWPVFYHSPTFRKTSISYKRWTGKFIKLVVKQPGERFYVGRHCFSDMYCIKTGIVQIFSADDTTAPLLSLTSGTVFGDVSFIIPPVRRKITVRCLTFCEIYKIDRGSILASLHKFPEDRQLIMNQIRAKIKHARELFKCKERIKGRNRSEDEGVLWLKQRWWDVLKIFQKYKVSSTKSRKQMEFPVEINEHHCIRYIGQVVLCEDVKLHKKIFFQKLEFPWIISPDSSIIQIWQKIILFSAYAVLFLYPPNIILPQKYKATWYKYFKLMINILYTIDVVISWMTGSLEDYSQMSSTAIIMARLQDPFFYLDMLCTPFLEELVSVTKNEELIQYIEYLPVLKIYTIFWNKLRVTTWNCDRKPIFETLLIGLKVFFIYCYVLSHLIFSVVTFHTELFDETFWFGKLCLSYRREPPDCYSHIPPELRVLSVPLGRFMAIFISLQTANKTADRILYMCLVFFFFLITTFLKMNLICHVYFKYRGWIDYQFFVTRLRQHLIRLKIHPDLLKRLGRFLDCHWKYFHGMDIIEPHLLKDEPYSVYYKLHGEVAERIISNSKAFKGANSNLIRELAEKAEYMILPKGAALLLFGSYIENVYWVVDGVINCEYESEHGEKVKTVVPIGDHISIISVFFNRACIRTYTTASDVEILFIKVSDFNRTIRSYQDEWLYLRKTQSELGGLFDKILVAYIKKHKRYQRRLRAEIFHSKSQSALAEQIEEMQIPVYLKEYRRHPEARCFLHWMLFRAIIVFLQTALRVLRATSDDELYGPYYDPVLLACRVFCILDMVFKLFHPYYNKRGVIITNRRKCVIHYLSKNFVLDILGLIFSWPQATKQILDIHHPQILNIITNCGNMFHFYMVDGYLNYISDVPTIKAVFIKILGWQMWVIVWLFYMWGIVENFCITRLTEADGVPEEVRLSNTCWVPAYFNISYNFIYFPELTLLQYISYFYVQTAAFGLSSGLNQYGKSYVHLVVVNFTLKSLFWIQKCFCLAWLMLLYRGETEFQYGVMQLKKFLKEERIEKSTIDRSMNYFEYWWKRTAGVDMKILMNERIGAVFKQDLNYYFYKKTIRETDSLLRGGELLERAISRIAEEGYFLPEEDIIRQRHICAHIYIVHRGSVAVYRDDEEVTKLKKGSMFGQLEGTTLRPLRISVRTLEHTDVLIVEVKKFQEAISEDTRDRIRNNSQAKFDFMAMRKHTTENPYNTVQYLLRGAKVLHLPHMAKHLNSETSKLYELWLLLVWVLNPIFSFGLVIYFVCAPTSMHRLGYLFGLMVFSDFVQIVHMVVDFFTMELCVVQERCQYRYIRLKKFFSLWFYADLLSLLLNFVTIIDDDWDWQAARVFRMYGPILYYRRFCRSFKDQKKAIMMKFILFALVLHSLTCGWIYVACRRKPNEKVGRFFKVEKLQDNARGLLNKPSQWQYADDWREGGGCPRQTLPQVINGTTTASFVSPTNWAYDYLVAFYHVVSAMTYNRLDLIYPAKHSDFLYNIIINYIMYYIDLWLSSLIMSIVYTKMHEMYMLEIKQELLLEYLKNNGISKYVIKAIKTYFRLLWQKYKGCWLPELTHQVPLCLREDIMSSLYIHHLLSPPLFQNMPMHFLKQIAVRLKRVVYFPGKYIVQEGNIIPCIYFIHEGEVERWYTNKEGESKLSAVLTMNGFFGIISGLFPNTPHQYSYYTRTVVDIVYLQYEDWQDILNAYPDLKYELYMGAIKYKKDSLKRHASGQSLGSLGDKDKKAN